MVARLNRAQPKQFWSIKASMTASSKEARFLCEGCWQVSSIFLERPDCINFNLAMTSTGYLAGMADN